LKFIKYTPTPSAITSLRKCALPSTVKSLLLIERVQHQSDVTAGIVLVLLLVLVLFPLYSLSFSFSPPIPDERER
jgi:hypothetical protein